MTNVINFSRTSGSAETASMLASFTDLACAGKFDGAIVVAISEDGPSFEIKIGDASTSALLAAIGALDVIKARLVRVVEAEQNAED